MQDNSALGRALAMVRDLRARCPWDRAQTRQSLRPYLVEEVLELDQALGEGERDSIRDELSDLLLHLAFQLVIAEELGEFSPDDVAEALERKMRRRHPHLFDLGDAEPWERLKRKERRGRTLAGITPTLPPLLKAYLRMGGMIGEGAVIDRQFNTIDVCLVLPMERVQASYECHYRPQLPREAAAAA